MSWGIVGKSFYKSLSKIVYKIYRPLLFATILLLGAGATLDALASPKGEIALLQDEPVVITYGTDVTFDFTTTAPNFRETLFEADPTNATRPEPTTVYEATAVGNSAHAATTAAPDEAGVAIGRVGLLYSTTPGEGQTFGQIANFPVEVTLKFSYELEVDWTAREGSSNAGIAIRPFTAPWYEFLGLSYVRKRGARESGRDRIQHPLLQTR